MSLHMWIFIIIMIILIIVLIDKQKKASNKTYRDIMGYFGASWISPAYLNNINNINNIYLKHFNKSHFTPFNRAANYTSNDNCIFCHHRYFHYPDCQHFTNY